MKKILLITVIVIFVSISSFAQNSKFFRFGLLGSPAYAWLKPDTKGWESKSGQLKFGYGFIGEFTIADNYSFATSIDIAYSGGKLQYNTDSTKNTNSYDLQYLEIPLSLKMKTNEIGYITYYGKFGAGVGFNLKARGDVEIEDLKGNKLPSNIDIDIADDINFFRTSFIIGLGIEYSLSETTSIIVGATFNNGLTDILKSKDSKAINNFISIDLGILF
ncbi:MAG: hypothetical protein CVT98_08660 [Bacteroidetes bacterium HGW-Bacteroidetes-15]|nr:MAG: hypothetical protein CVT98_08660 [Bacteroidetes bacterium HGW-Bacteroidetes-15]